MENQKLMTPHTPTPWIFHVQGEPNQYAILSPDKKKWVIGLIHNGEQLPAQQEANLRFIVHAVNNHAALVLALESSERALTACAAWLHQHGKERAETANHWAAEARTAIDNAQVEA